MNKFEASYRDIAELSESERAEADSIKALIDQTVLANPDADITELKQQLDRQQHIVMGVARAFAVLYEYETGERTIED